MPADTLVKMEHITMEFPNVKALDDVHFELKKGEIHALVGENGAGKSTLMKILCGVYKKTAGTIEIKGIPVEIENVEQAQALNISIIYQELNLFSYLTVAENIFIGRQPMKNGRIDWDKMHKDAQKVLDDLNVDIDSHEIVKNLSIAKQQMVEVAKAISRNVEVLIMDEPTATLTKKEIDELFKLMSGLKEKGVGIIYISHRLEELKQIGDRVTVFRDGHYVDTLDINDDLKLDYLIKLMVGRELKDKFPHNDALVSDEEALRVEHISTKNLLKDCSFYVRKGEILGIAGLMGAGRTELMRAIVGADKRSSGDIYINGKKVDIQNVYDATELCIGFITEDRKGQGLLMNFDVKQNITIASLDKISRFGVMNLKKERAVSQEMCDALKVKTPNLRQRVKFLSGGNQQKVVLAKWMLRECNIIIFDEPTRGIDVGAKFEIYKLMIEMAKKGAAIIMVSSELPEILGMSDRIIVMHEGRITGELTKEEATQEKILQYATGGV